ncbi:MAG TPA: exodeoxyribonuclease III [Polyangiaceae bacterium]|nr:exodeoxyribonuclease III [Polyangiaceae bacterium]
MRIATWNVNSVVARLDFVLDYLTTRQPDIVCVQELKIDDQGFPRLAFAQAGYVAATHGQPQWNGVAVFVRTDAGPPPVILQAGLPGQDAQGARLLTVRALGLTVTSVYVPNGKSTRHPDFAMKLAWLDALVDHVAATSDPAALHVIGGDFNLCPGDLDTWDPVGHAGHIFHTEAERSRFERLLALGYRDLFREKYPNDATFSWWDYRAGAFHKKHGLRIDLLLGSKSLVDRVTSVTIDRDFRKKRDGRIPSDHAPVVAELDLAQV